MLRDVMFGNRRYFRQLLAGSEEGIASNILADRLKRLVNAGLLTREDAGPGRRAAYSLTEAAWPRHTPPRSDALCGLPGFPRNPLISAYGPDGTAAYHHGGFFSEHLGPALDRLSLTALSTARLSAARLRCGAICLSRQGGRTRRRRPHLFRRWRTAPLTADVAAAAGLLDILAEL